MHRSCCECSYWTPDHTQTALGVNKVLASLSLYKSVSDLSAAFLGRKHEFEEMYIKKDLYL